MNKILAASTLGAAGLALGLSLALSGTTGPTAHVVTASAPVPATGPASLNVVKQARPAPVATTSTTTAPVRPVAAPKAPPVVHTAPAPQPAPAAPQATIPATQDGTPLPPAATAAVWVWYPGTGACGQVSPATAEANHLPSIPAGDCVNGTATGPQYVTPGSGQQAPTLTPEQCAADTACSAGNGSGATHSAPAEEPTTTTTVAPAPASTSTTSTTAAP